MQVGNESINVQRDLNIVTMMNKSIENIQSMLRVSMPDIVATDNDAERSFEVYDKYKRKLKNSVINKKLMDISKALSKRFGINILVEDRRSGLTNLVSCLIPPINYKVANMAVYNMDILFPKKQKAGVLWDSTATRSEKVMYDILNNIKSSLETGKIEVDLKNAYVKGLEASTFIIYIDMLAVNTIRLASNEISALIMNEVGHIFAYLEYLTSTTNSSKVLADTFLKEKFAKGKDPVESFKIALEESNPDIKVDTSSPMKILESLDAYILKTYRFGQTQQSIKIEFKRLSDQFTTRFGMGEDIASALQRLYTLKLVNNTEDVVEDSWFFRFMRMVAYLTILALSFILFNVFGLIVFVAYVTIKLLSYILSAVINFIKNVFIAIFSTDVNQTATSENIDKRLVKIKLELVRQLRSEKVSDEGKRIIVDHIDNIKEIIKKLRYGFAVLGEHNGSTLKTNFNKMEDVNFLTEILQENEMHFMQSKFKLKG